MAEYFLYKKAKLDADEGWTLIMDLSGFEARHIPYCDLRVVRVNIASPRRNEENKEQK